MSAQPADIRLDSGAMGRIWEIRAGLFGWAHPNGSEGQANSFRGAECALEAADQPSPTSPTTLREALEGILQTLANTLTLNKYTPGYIDKLLTVQAARLALAQPDPAEELAMLREKLLVTELTQEGCAAAYKAELDRLRAEVAELVGALEHLRADGLIRCLSYGGSESYYNSLEGPLRAASLLAKHRPA